MVLGEHGRKGLWHYGVRAAQGPVIINGDFGAKTGRTSIKSCLNANLFQKIAHELGSEMSVLGSEMSELRSEM